MPRLLSTAFPSHSVVLHKGFYPQRAFSWKVLRHCKSIQNSAAIFDFDTTRKKAHWNTLGKKKNKPNHSILSWFSADVSEKKLGSKTLQRSLFPNNKKKKNYLKTWHFQNDESWIESCEMSKWREKEKSIAVQMKHCEVNHTELLVPATHVFLIAGFSKSTIPERH